jgi:hypothetical protein
MSKIINDLTQKLTEQGKSQRTIDTYILRIKAIHGPNKPIKSLRFLHKIDNIRKFFEKNKMSLVSQKSYLGTINTILKVSGKPADLTAIDLYKNFFTSEQLEELKPDKKSDKQENNWIDWEKVIEIKQELYNKAKQSFDDNITPSKTAYNNILQNFILSLYVNLQPRRSLDYSSMKIQRNDEEFDVNTNYLTHDNKMIFNNYKTKDKYGQQIIDISQNKQLMNDLEMYLSVRKDNDNDMLLVKQNGKSFNQVNDITRLLNKIFNSNISVNMLRTIFITSKYGDMKKEQQSDANAMGHSVNMQQNVYNKV